MDIHVTIILLSQCLSIHFGNVTIHYQRKYHHLINYHFSLHKFKKTKKKTVIVASLHRTNHHTLSYRRSSVSCWVCSNSHDVVRTWGTVSTHGFISASAGTLYSASLLTHTVTSKPSLIKLEQFSGLLESEFTTFKATETQTVIHPSGIVFACRTTM